MDASAMTASLIVGAFALGAALGAAHFLSLWRCVGLMQKGRTGLAVTAQVLRFALLAVVARHGAGFFLSAAAGVILVRLALTRHCRRLA
jgi:N-ATPase, AtpR subunit